MNWTKRTEEDRQNGMSENYRRPLKEEDKHKFEIFGNSKFAGDGNTCSGGVEIEAHYNYNGSGGRAFGGAASWPHMTVRVAFRVGQEKQRDELIEKIQALLETELKKIGNV